MAAKFKVLLWKNFKTEKRMWLLFLFEIFFIFLLGLIIIANPMRNQTAVSSISKKEMSSVRIYAEDSLSNIDIIKNMYGGKPFPNKLVYAPELSYAKEITTKVAGKLGLVATNAYDPRDCFAQITFPNHTGLGVPKQFSLQISFPGKFRTFHSKKIYSNFWLSRCTGSLTLSLEDSPHDMQTDLYIREGFLQLQHLIVSEWLSKLDTRIPGDMDVRVQSFRYDTRKRLCLPTQSPNNLTLLYYFMFFLPFLNMVWKFGREREENMVVYHWHYGCNSFLYWLSHFISSFIHFLILDIFVLLLVVISWQAKDPMEYEDNLSILYFFFLLIFTTSELIIAAMIIVTLVPRAINAIYLAILLWLIQYASFATVLEYSVEVKTFWLIFSLVIMFNNDFVFGTRFLSTLDKSTANDVKFLLLTTIGSVLLKLLILVIIMHFRPGCYIERIPLATQCKRKNKSSGDKISKHDLKVLYQEGYQNEPINGDRTIVVLHVSRSLSRFRQPTRRVLKDVNLAMYFGEITVILGHGSCGKTTLATLLAGWNAPDKGTIAYFGQDINYKREIMRLSDIRMPDGGIFDYLTAFEMLTYFVHIKSITKDRGQLQDEFSKWYKTIKTVFRYGDEVDRLGKDMTYEQKRILSLSCVLCCDTKIIILDEPTAYMKPSFQPIFWNVLKREKAERSIIVMTNSIREAEAIGDRVAVFSDRTPKAYGTLMYLKTTFDTGFDLIILKDKVASSEKITSFLKTFIDDIKLTSRNQEQLIYKISTEKRGNFQQLLIELQKHYDELGIIDARLLTSNLNDVFFALGANKTKVNIPKEPPALHIDYLPKNKRCRQQWSAMFFKKLKHHPSMIIPLIMCIVSIFLISIFIQLFVVLRDRGDLEQFSKMSLGFDKNSPHGILSNLDKCKFVGIQNVKMGVIDGRDRSQSFTFMNHSFYCSQKYNFTQYVKKTNNWNHLFGALESRERIVHKIYINQHILHSAPLVMNLLHNMILRHYHINDTVVKLVSYPVRVPSPDVTGLLNTELEHLFVPVAIGIVLPITLCSFIIDLVDERESNSFMLMTIAGLRIDIYWLANLVWDYLTFLAYSVLFQIIFIAWYFEDIRFGDNLLIFFIMNLYSFPLLASIYFTATITKSPPYRAFLITCVIHIASGLFAFVIYWDVLLAHVCYLYGLLILPTFAMLDGISNVYVMSNFLKTCHDNCVKADFCDVNNICNSMPECCAYSFFEWGNSGIIRSITFLLITTLIFILLLFWVEIRQRESKFNITPKIKDMYTKTSPDDDENVAKMRKRIASTELLDMSKKRVVVDQVERSIPNDSMVLRTISFDVEKSSCLAIFGANHSGKSHLCRQIIGQDSFRFGDIYVCGIPMKYNMHYAWRHMGYVPQVRGLLHEFEVIEILHFFCLIRGVPKDKIRTVVTNVVSLFGLSGVTKYRIDELTMGQQRKVSIAVALMASNDVLILDEPTAGLPEYIAREIWNVLRYLISMGKTIVLTTRNMSECDALSDAVLLIDDQDMLGYGNSQNLRRKLVGIHISVKLRREGVDEEEIEENLRIDVDNLHLFMLFMHGEATLVNRVDNILQFYLPIENVNYAMLYGSMEKNRERLNIIDYSINQGNLDELLQKKK